MTSPPKIYVAGHQGMVGSAIVRVLQGQGQANVIREAWLVGVKKLMFLGSSCIYPKLAKVNLEQGLKLAYQDFVTKNI